MKGIRMPALGLALAHATRPGSKSLLVGGVAALASAALVAALALGGAIAGNTRRFLTERYMGEVVVAQGPQAALFGYAVVTGNERQPPIADFERVARLVRARSEVASASPLLTGYLSLVPDGEREERCIAFGIDGADAGPRGLGFALEPGSTLPRPGEVLVSDSFARKLGGKGGPALRRGDIVTAAALKDAGLGLKPLRLSGVYAYDGGVAELDRIVYLEAGTARRLLLDEAEGNGVAEASPEPPSDEELFADEALIAAPPKSLASSLAPSAGAVNAAATGAKNRWHYLRVRLEPGSDEGAFIASLNAAFARAGLGAVAIGWEAASSGYASSATAVRAILLGGIGIAALFALLVLSNALALLTASRRRTIGTVRALGATRSFVFAWTAAEGLTAAGAGAALGALLAALCLAAVSSAAPAIEEPAFREIFASDRFVAAARPMDIILAAAIAVAAAAPAILGASLRSLRAAPSDAMRD